MDHYADIQLRPDPEFVPHQLLSALYAQLHRALVQLQSSDIGISFPEYDARRPSLGQRLRLHGTEASLRRLLSMPWIMRMRDHVVVAPPAPVPASATHCRVTRVQAKSSPARLRRRAMRRHGIDADTASARIPDTSVERLQLPFVTIGSASTGQPAFPLFINQHYNLPSAIAGAFNSYGLSPVATIPWF